MNNHSMTREQWQELYDRLDNIYSDFLLAYPESDHGRNAKIRAAAGMKVESAIRLTDNYIRQAPEAFNLLTGGEDVSDMGRTIAYDEFRQPRYFQNDMGDFLRKIREKMQSLS